MGSLYRSQHELVFVFKVGAAPHINNVELGKYGRYRDERAGNTPAPTRFSATRDADLAGDGQQSDPRILSSAADAILDCYAPERYRFRRLRRLGHDACRGPQDRAAPVSESNSTRCTATRS